MAKRDGLDYIYVVWQDPESRSNYVIGTLTRNGCYEFSYGVQVDQARSHGFTPLVSFPEFSQTYRDKSMFPAFACRLPDPRRRGIESILEKYSLNEYDEFEFLKKSEARLPTDTLAFIDPILDGTEPVVRSFFVAGVRHCMGCEGRDCARVPKIEPGMKLVLCPEPDNKYDEYAVQVKTADGTLIGYVPRYYSQAVSSRLRAGGNYTCEVVEHTQAGTCGECMKVVLRIPPDAVET